MGKSKVVKRTLDARRDTLDFRDRMFEPTLIEVPSEIPVTDYLKHKIPVLDQGTEGACTGFGLATVANYLLRLRKVKPDTKQVSARMFYEMARRYDEWPGEDYSGSSARGAMKGWNKHGVCAETDWPYSPPRRDRAGFTEARSNAARLRPLGAYFRVNHQDLVAMHAAISEVGILYATASVHAGWDNVSGNGLIPPSDKVTGGHAFAVVAYDANGFWIQNSWGKDWGRQGLARISYDDWLDNATDVWVARLGAPINLRSGAATAVAHSSAAAQSSTYSHMALRPHIVSLGNDGKLRAGGNYGTTEDELANIFEDDFPRLMGKPSAGKPKHLLLYAHGGLTGESSAVQRVAEYRSALLENDVYPLAFVWRTDYLSTVGNILREAVRQRRPEGTLDSSKDFMLDRLDDALEPVARLLTGKAGWDEMKENAIAASGLGSGATMVADHVAKLCKKYPELKIHITGHSAGSILHAPLLQLLSAKGRIKSGPIAGRTGHGLPIESIALWAPACTVELFKDTYLPALRAKSVKRFTMFVLKDQAEQNDSCAGIYNKSLLYLVSNAFEEKARIPEFRDGVPILGMEKFISADKDLIGVFAAPGTALVLAPNDLPKGSRDASGSQTHGDFDNDPNTVMASFLRMLQPEGTIAVKLAASGKKAGKAARPLQPEVELKFNVSSSTLRNKRQRIDINSRVPAI